MQLNSSIENSVTNSKILLISHIICKIEYKRGTNHVIVFIDRLIRKLQLV